MNRERVGVMFVGMHMLVVRFIVMMMVMMPVAVGVAVMMLRDGRAGVHRDDVEGFYVSAAAIVTHDDLGEFELSQFKIGAATFHREKTMA